MCAVTYLSLFPDALREVFLTGGMPPALRDNPDEVYKRLWKRVSERNKAFYVKYPEDITRVRGLVRFLERFAGGKGMVRLPSEGVLSARRFLQLGMGLGFHGELVLEVLLMESACIVTSTTHKCDDLELTSESQAAQTTCMVCLLLPQISPPPTTR